MKRPSNFIVSAVFRNQTFRGPSHSDQLNDFQKEVIRDLTNLRDQWNNSVVKLMTTVPDGSLDSTVNAFNNGLDGQTIFINASATNTLSNGKYFNTVKDRPNTLFEQVINLYTYVDDQIVLLQDIIDNTAVGGGLTSDQKTRIGDNIFNSSVSSSSTSLDGKTKNQSGYITQIAKDFYGTDTPTLNSNGAKLLTNASLKEMVEALLALHNGSWNNDIALDHSGIDASSITTGSLAQHLVNGSVNSPGGIDDTFVGSPTTTQQDLNQIRNILKKVKGTVSYSTDISVNSSWDPLTIKPTDFIKLTNLKGSVVRTDTNPWGYSYTDIPDILPVFETVRDFTGQSSVGDTSPSYPSTFGFSQGDSLVNAIGLMASGVTGLNSNLLAVSGNLASHLSDTGNPHATNLSQVSALGGTAYGNQILIIDSGNHYNSPNVELALQEIFQVTDSGINTVQDYSTTLSGLLSVEIETKVTGTGIDGGIGYFDGGELTADPLDIGFSSTVGSLHINRSPSGVHSSIDIDGSFAYQPLIISGSYTAANDYTLFIDATDAPRVVGLPDPTTIAGRIYIVKKIDNSVNSVTMSGLAGSTIDGSPTQVLASGMQVLRVQATELGYFVI